MNAVQDPLIIIVGAGPAGLSTALHLAQAAPQLAARTLVLEKARHPRPKLCGGGLLPDAERVLSGLGLDAAEVPHIDVDWARFEFNGMGFRLRPEVQRGYAFRVIRRAEFDAWLAGKARRQGITLREATTVRAVQLTAEGVRVETDSGFLTTRVVVGADGSTGVVRRVVQRGDRNHTARLLEIVTVPRPERSFHTQSDSYFDFRFVPQGIQGYTWDFPALDAGRAMRVRGIFDSRAAPAPSEIPLQQALAQEFQLHGYRMDDYRLEGFPLHWFDPRSPLACPGILLVGDAAGSDALFGEGISIALGYGKIAAAALVDAFSRGDFSFRSYRSAVLHSGMGRSLSRRTWFARFFYRLRWPPIQRLIWHWLGWLVTFIMNHFMINWAARQDKLSGQRKIIPSG